MKKYILFPLIVISIVLSVIWPGNVVSAPYHENKIIEKDELDIWLDKLETFECNGCEEGYKRIDANGLYSYGCLQFQAATFWPMWFAYTDRGIYNADTINSCSEQKRVAKALLLKEGKRAARHWYTSVYVRGLGEPPVVF